MTKPPTTKIGLEIKRENKPWVYAIGFVLFICAIVGLIIWLAQTFVPEGQVNWPG